MDKKVLITGGHGLIGTMLVNELADDSYEVLATDKEQLDITDEVLVNDVIGDFKPSYLINCAEITNFVRVEENYEYASLVNGTAVGYLAKACKKTDTKFIHISSHYVFGDNSPYGYTEMMKPQNEAYNQFGKTKWLGELEAMRHNMDSYIVRTSWLFGPYGSNIVDSIINIGVVRKEVDGAYDQVSVPTYSKDISRGLKVMLNGIDNYKPGVYHAVSGGMCSKYELSKKIFEILGLGIKVNKVNLADINAVTKFPNFSVLKNTKLPGFQSWEKAVEEYIRNYKLKRGRSKQK